MRLKKNTEGINYTLVDRLTKELGRGKAANKGKIYRLIREALGYSQSDFARKIGVQGVTVSRWENNRVETPFMTYEQAKQLQTELQRIKLSLADLPDVMVILSVDELNQLGLLSK